MAILGKLFNRTVSEGAAIAFGAAAAPVLVPAVEEIRQSAWSTYPNRAISPELAAAIVAESVDDKKWGEGEATLNGVNPDRFDLILNEVLNAPGLPDLLALWRRNLIDEPAFRHGLRKAKLEAQWDVPLEGLHDVLLSPSELANARQQGFISDTQQHDEAQLQGVTPARADIQFELSGLPPGVDVLQRAANRNLIDEAKFAQGVREGHTKTKYTQLRWQMRNPLLSAATYVRLYLKGWISQPEMNAGGALWGYTPEQMNQWYLSEGRPAAPQQMATAIARGVDGPDGRPMDEAQFLKGIKESDIRPEWGPMLYGIRFAYPPLFQISRLVESKAIDTKTAVEWAKMDRYAPEVVAALQAFWESSTGTTTAADTHVAKAETQLWGTLHKSYVAGKTPASVARTTLAEAGVTASSIDGVLKHWDEEKALTRKWLTATQIKKSNDPPYDTTAGKLAALHELGYDATDAQAFLDE